MLTFIKTWFINLFSFYNYHPKIVIIACYYNPNNNPYRYLTFKKWYDTIKHLEHRIVECAIGEQEFQLPLTDSISRIRTQSNLWHKEAILNLIINKLPNKYEYVFWMDTDVILTNRDWLNEAYSYFKRGVKVIQPFSVCKHLSKFDYAEEYIYSNILPTHYRKEIKRNAEEKHIWNSFAYANRCGLTAYEPDNYNFHGHVGFVWGTSLEILKNVSLFDKALIGGADHIIAHATIGEFDAKDINEVFADCISDVKNWMDIWYYYTKGKIGYVDGLLVHLYHGELKDRNYYHNTKNFSKYIKHIKRKDENGLYQVNKGTKSSDYYEEKLKIRDGQLKKADIKFNTPTKTKDGGFQVTENDIESGQWSDKSNDSSVDFLTTFVNYDNNLNEQSSKIEFEGGDFGGGGAGADYDTDSNTFS